MSSFSQMPTGLATPSAVEAARRPPSPSGVGRLVSSDSIEAGGFTPGAVIGERYRIIGLLGRGGMGEVYRADDLKLGQPVALKFLPKALSEDPARLERFYAEVRIARQVSHPNVCRVYDIAELDKQHYLSMEYVDGEDLASLLKRIGRLPNDKALEIARQLCAGLAAAHDKGALHRDLKPANIMIDGRGRARITDFGLAVAADETQTEGEISGTPAYMAPEQLAGKGASVQSDVYSLGLVLYELYTGRKAFEAKTLEELKRKREEGTPAALSEITRDIDPIVDRVILRCLEKDPRARPISALAVAAALPGGDPLAAALAAGETPSPEMVAAAGKTEGLRPGVAWSLLAAVVIGSFLIVLFRERTRANLFHRVPLDKAPAVLVERSKQILQRLGFSEPPSDNAFGFAMDTEYLRYVQEHDKSKTRWENLERGAIKFWYRQSPRVLAPLTHWNTRVTAGDPPSTVSGMARIWLDPRGHLNGLMVTPPQVEGPSGAAALDWAALFSEAGLDPAKWTPTESRWTPFHYADARAAWSGSFSEQPKIPIRIEAAAYRGKPIYFEMVAPWTRPSRMQPFRQSAGQRASSAIALVLLGGLAIGGVLLARRNLRLQRGDRRGAFRLALFVLAVSCIAWLFGASHVADFNLEVILFAVFLSRAFFIAVLVWGLYIALEPYVRRRWPATIVSWSRLLSGSLRDSLVGRDILIGFAAHILAELILLLEAQFSVWLGFPVAQPGFFSINSLSGARAMIAELLNGVTGGIFFGLAFLLLLFLLRMLLRKQWAAGALFVLILASLRALQSEAPALAAVFGALTGWIFLFVMMRFGLVAMIAAFLFNELFSYPITTEVSAWYAGVGFTALALTAGLALYGFYTSLAGRPVFGKAALED